MKSDFGQRLSTLTPQSRLAGAITFLVAALLFAPMLISRADTYETLDQSFEFKTGGTVKIDSGVGEVKVEVWAEELVHVSAKKVEPAGRAIGLSDMAFFNTKSLLTIKSQPAEANTRIDMIVYVPRNTNLRITTASGAVQIRGAVSSAMVETKTGNIRLEAPPSLDADLVLTTASGIVRASLPIDPYGTPTPKSLQGKLGAGGNPVILRSTGGNIQIAALEHEVDQDVATIPSGPPPSSSSDSSSNYYDNNVPDSLYGRPNNNSRPQSNNNNYQPYSYGGNYGGLSGRNGNSNNNNNNNGNSSSNGNNQQSNNNGPNTSIFGGGRSTDSSSNSAGSTGSGYGLGGLGGGVSHGRNQDSVDNQGSMGVHIIPPPGGMPRDDDDANNQNNQNYQNQPDPAPPLQRRKPQPQQQQQRNNSNNSDNNDINYNNRPQYTQPDPQAPYTLGDDRGLASNGNLPTPAPGAINQDRPIARRNNQPPADAPDNRPQKAADNGDNGADVIKIDTKLVNLSVSVLDRNGRAVTNLKDGDFQIFEDNVQQQIAHFESVNTPFNLVLLIDLSGSIIDKIDILRRAALKFIDVTRPEDKVAVVTFTRSVQVVSDLTNDRQLLRQRLQYMHMPRGGTAFYEAMWFTLDQIVKPVSANERTAVVLLTDGVDNSISVTYPIPSRVTFEQILRKTQEANALVFPIYLDTENENVQQEIEAPESYVLARKQLAALGEASGGVFFRAERPENLEGVYEKIAADLRTLYSIAYYPTNAERDGSWRKVKVKVDKGDVAVRTRRGYYAK
jgi:VWFA-related protein